MGDTLREPTSCTFYSQGLALRYVDWGNDGAPCLIFIHGSSDHARSWDWTAREFADRFHVVALDLRGHGDSQWSPDGAYLVAYHVVDFVELVNSLNAQKVAIVAHSLGGSIASRFAALYPERVSKLALIDGFGPPPSAYAKWLEYGAVNRTRDWIEQRREAVGKAARRLGSLKDASARMASSNPHLTTSQAEHLARHGVRGHPDGYGWKFDPRVNHFGSEDFGVDITTFWREVKAPTLLCRGGDSWTDDPELAGQAQHLTDYRSVVIPGAGHWPHHDQFESFVRTLREFLHSK